MQAIGKCIWNIVEKTVYWVLNLLFHLAGKELSDDMFTAFMQFVKFGIVGVSNTMLSYGIYAAGLLVFRCLGILDSIDYLAAQAIAFVLSVLWSFYWNNKMVFALQEGEKRSIWKALLKTYVSYSFTGLFLNSILLVFFVRVMHMSEFAAPLINLVISVPVNFIINKCWAFKTS